MTYCKYTDTYVLPSSFIIGPHITSATNMTRLYTRWQHASTVHLKLFPGYGCYKVAYMQGCYKFVTRFLQLRLLQGCYKVVCKAATRFYARCYRFVGKIVTRLLQGCMQGCLTYLCLHSLHTHVTVVCQYMLYCHIVNLRYLPLPLQLNN